MINNWGSDMGFFASLWKARFGAEKLNSDPIQREFAENLICAAEGGFFQEFAVKLFVDKYGWSQSEKELRLAHALKIVKALRPDLHKEARTIGIEQIG
jgi:hypothetical protein